MSQPYGYKKNSKHLKKGDGCFLCTQSRKTTKTAVRRKAKKEANDEIRRITNREEEAAE
jgi:hypothetical protein